MPSSDDQVENRRPYREMHRNSHHDHDSLVNKGCAASNPRHSQRTNREGLKGSHRPMKGPGLDLGNIDRNRLLW